MNDTDKLRHALSVCQAQRNANADAVIELQVALAEAHAEIAELKAAKQKETPEQGAAKLAAAMSVAEKTKAK